MYNFLNKIEIVFVSTPLLNLEHVFLCLNDNDDNHIHNKNLKIFL